MVQAGSHERIETVQGVSRTYAYTYDDADRLTDLTVPQLHRLVRTRSRVAEGPSCFSLRWQMILRVPAWLYGSLLGQFMKDSPDCAPEQAGIGVSTLGELAFPVVLLSPTSIYVFRHPDAMELHMGHLFRNKPHVLIDANGSEHRIVEWKAREQTPGLRGTLRRLLGSCVRPCSQLRASGVAEGARRESDDDCARA